MSHSHAESSAIPAQIATWPLSITRHPFAIVFFVALLTRLIAIYVISEFFGDSLTVDDDLFHSMGAAMALGETASWDSFTHWLYWHASTFMVPLTLLYKLVGPYELAGQIYVAILGSGAAVIVTRISMTVMSARWALLAGALMALLPSEILWSSLVLKDSAVWFYVSLLTLLVITFNTSFGRRMWITALAISVTMFLLGYLRQHTMLVAAYALLPATLLGSQQQRFTKFLVGVGLVLAVPWSAGIGPGGYSFLTSVQSLEELRMKQAKGANTAFVPVPESEPTEPAPGSQATGIGLDGWAARVSAPPPPTLAATPPPSRKEDGPELFGGGGSTLRTNLAHLPKGIFVMLVEPVPWGEGGSTGLELARVENIGWYALLIAAVAGLRAGWTRLRILLFPIAFMVGALLVYALSEGNLGTAYRHRAEFAWVVLVLATVGAQTLWAWYARRRAVRIES